MENNRQDARKHYAMCELRRVRTRGFKVFRFWNSEVLQGAEEVA